MRTRIAAVVLLAALIVGASACSSSSDYVYVQPASVQEAGPDLWQIQLTPSAAERTGIETTEVIVDIVEGAERLVIPYSAVMYHFDGTTWTYTNPSNLTYLRAPIEIESIEGDRAILTAGPPPGVTIVTVGAAELYGVEFGIGK